MAFIINLLRNLLSLYAVLLLIRFALPYVTSTQQAWMTALSKICEPGVRLGNRVAAKLLPERRVQWDLGNVTAVVLCWLARLVLRFFL